MSCIPVTKPKRLLAFGCSFTEYRWPTWCDILAYDLDVPLFNFGLAGAGNEYIANLIFQFHNLYGFKENDLVMVQWSGLLREDRFYPRYNNWILPGQIHSATRFFTDDFKSKYVSYSNCMIKQFALMQAVLELLNYNTIFLNVYNYNVPCERHEKHTKRKIRTIYETLLNNIEPSFVDILWRGDIQRKIHANQHKFGVMFKEAHPSPLEHFSYINHVLSHNFKNETVDKIYEIDRTLNSIIKNDIRYDSNNIFSGMDLYTKIDHLFLTKNYAGNYINNMITGIDND